MKRFYIIGGVVFAFAILSGAGYLLWLVNPKPEAKVQPETPYPKIAQPSYQEKTDSIVEKATTTDSDTATRSADSQLKKLVAGTKDNAELQAYYSGLIDLYSLKGDYKTALKYALEAEARLHTHVTAGTVAYYYAELGQHAESAKYYRLAMSRTEKVSDPKMISPYNDYRVRAIEEESRS